MQPFRHHRVNPAEEFYLTIPVLGGFVGEVLHATQAWVATWARHRHHNVPDRARETGGIDDRLNLPLSNLRCGQRARVPGGEIENDFIVRWDFSDESKHRLHGVREPVIVSMCGEDMDSLAVLVVLGRHAAVPIGGQRAKVGERPYPIVAGYDHLQHQLLQGGWCGCKPAGQYAHQRLWTFDQRTYSLVTVRGVRMGGEIIQVAFRLSIDLSSCLLKQWLIEATIAQFAGEVADRRKQPTGDRDHAVKQRSEGFLCG